MFAWNSHGTELKRFFRQPITRAALAVMLLIPLLYGAMYVWAFWDPTDHLDNLPVALVNADVAAKDDDGDLQHYGQDLVDELVKNDDIKWVRTDETTARAGMDSGAYYFTVTIPSDFTTRINSFSGDNPTAADLQVTYDDSNSFLASTLGKSAMLEVQTALREKISTEAVKTLLVGVGDARDGFAKASDGAFTLSDGLGDAVDGSETLKVGADQLHAGALKLAAGSSKLAAGAASAASGTGSLAAGVGSLDTGAQQLATGLDTLNTAMPGLTSGLTQLDSGTSAASAGASQLAAGTTSYLSGVKTAGAGATQLAAGAANLTALQDGLASAADTRTGAPALAAGIETLAGNLSALTTGAGQYASGAESFADGAHSWVEGAESWRSQVDAATGGDGTSGTAQTNLVTATTQLAAGADKLADATSSSSDLGKGASTVAGGTAALAKSLDAIDANYLQAAQDALTAGDVDTAKQLLAQAHSGVQGAARSAESLADGASSVSEGLTGSGGVHASASQLAAGAQNLKAGWATINDAVSPSGSVEQGLASLSSGQQKLAASASQLSDGASRLADPATATQVQQLVTGAKTLAGGITTMSTAASNPTTGIPALQAGAKQLAAGFTSTDPSNPGLVSGATQLDAAAKSLAGGLGTLSDGASTASSGADELASGVSSLTTGAASLHAGTSELNAKVPALVDGVNQINSGAQSLASGTATLADGTDELAAKTPALTSGLKDAQAGADKLGTKLDKGAGDIPDDTSAERSARADAVAVPVSQTTAHVHAADSWGEGFAPFFISLGLWVGALITWLLLRPLQTRALMTSVNGFRMAWGSLNPALLLAVGQVVIMLSVMHFAIGLDPKNMLATVLFTLLAAAAFFSLQQFFQVTFGSAVGKVVIIVLLMIQLASCGGTYPIQTTPDFFQTINPYLPMTYVVEGLREAITGGIETRFWVATGILVAIFAVSLAATSVASSRKRVWTMSRLHPALSI
jgi:putative membrane protein